MKRVLKGFKSIKTYLDNPNLSVLHLGGVKGLKEKGICRYEAMHLNGSTFC